MMLSLPTRKKKKPIPLPQASPAERRRAVPRSRSFSSDLNNRINQNPSSFSLEISSESRKKEQYHVLSPSDLCNGLKDELPLRFVVKHGEYGDNQDSTFVENEELVAHFIQTVEYVLFMSGEGKRYRIPINSNTNACPIYNPTKNISDALNGYIFPSPKHLILESTCPMFVSVIQGHAEEDPKYTVEVNDVLFFPRETAKSAGSGKKKSIKCTHVASNLTKFIKEESKVIFSTRPHQILLPLSTLMRYITCPSTHVLVEVPKSASYVGVFLEQGKINNAICTRVFTSEQEAKLFALPEQFDLDIEHIKSGRREQEILCIESAERLKNFNPANVNYHVLYSQDCKVNDLRDDTQLGFYNAIVKNNGENGVICPQTLKRYFPLKFSQPDTINGISQPFQNASSIENRVALMEEAMQTLFTEIKLLKEKIDRLTLQQENNANEKKKDKELAESAFDMAVGVHRTVSELQRNELAMNTRLESLNGSIMNLCYGMPYTAADDNYQPLIPVKKLMNPPRIYDRKDTTSQMKGIQSISEMNRQYLMTLTVQQVGKLLEKLEMEQHVQNFQSKGIAGNRMAMLSEPDLMKLSVLKENQRSKLLQFISGEESAYCLLCFS